MTNHVSRRRIRAGVLVAAIVTAIAADGRPALARDKEHQQLAADLRILQEQAQQLQNLIAAVNDALKAVNTRLDQQVEANRKAQADQKLLIDNLTNDLRVVREKVDDSNVRVGNLAQEVDSLRQLVQGLQRPAVVSSEPDAGAPTSAAAGTAATAPPAPAPGASGQSPGKLWAQAYADYSQSLWDLAIEGFEAYIRYFPTSDNADDAQLLIGRAYIQNGKNDKAVEAFDKVIRGYPTTNSVPDSYYLKGLALKNLKQADRAREAFEFVVKNYPDSTAATLAKQQLGAR